MEHSNLQPSAHERVELFGAPSGYPAERPAPSQLNELSSVHAVQSTASRQIGGGDGQRPLPAPAPDGVNQLSEIRIRERDAAAEIEDGGCVLKLTPADVLALIKREREALDRERQAIDDRSTLIIEVVFAARALAHEALVRVSETGITGCTSCGGQDTHAPGCKAHRVLSALTALEETAAGAADSVGVVDQADGATGGAR